jgi:hypothetical protein
MVFFRDKESGSGGRDRSHLNTTSNQDTPTREIAPAVVQPFRAVPASDSGCERPGAAGVEQPKRYGARAAPCARQHRRALEDFRQTAFEASTPRGR